MKSILKKPKDVSKQVESSLCQFLHCKDECEFCGYHDEIQSLKHNHQCLIVVDHRI